MGEAQNEATGKECIDCCCPLTDTGLEPWEVAGVGEGGEWHIAERGMEEDGAPLPLSISPSLSY